MQKSPNFKCFYPMIGLQINSCVASNCLFFFGFVIPVLVLYWHKN